MSEARIFMKFGKSVFENLSMKYNLNENLTKTGTLREENCTFLITYRSVPLRMRNISHKSCRENQNTHFMFF